MYVKRESKKCIYRTEYSEKQNFTTVKLRFYFCKGYAVVSFQLSLKRKKDFL